MAASLIAALIPAPAETLPRVVRIPAYVASLHGVFDQHVLRTKS
ncbi:MAG TPA: hypothetical protein VK636_13365 [Gemmatimonadaceae bacterium]|nr:hypothetical protein [Gemmatimonadaceae bacterium]